MTQSRTPAEIRRDGNSLAAEGSLYLRQHAHNPIDWRPWNDEALALARREDRPIFLSVGYSSCHWCHVMEHEVFDDDCVAAYMNDHFVCIKVDREERPDLDAVYMDAVQAMIGRGGWPMSVFLTPDLKPFWGGTYVPRDPFLKLCESVMTIYTTRRPDLDQQADEVASRVNVPPPAPEGEAGMPDVEAVVDRLGSVYDPEWGGFSQAQKFPQPLKWRFLLNVQRRTEDEELGRRIRHTLDAMASGGIRDQLGGAFHRYTVERTWLVPHFEIMLYDNAQLASLYLEAADAFDEPRYLDVARGILDFFVREFEGSDGGILASYDADSGGEEGSFYVWTPEQIAAVAGDDGLALCRLLGVTEAGNFEGASILTRRVEPADEDEAGLFDRWCEPLRNARGERVRPGLDTKVVTAWNGMALSALVRGYKATGDERWIAAARRIVAQLDTVNTDADGRLLRASTDGAGVAPAVLDDYANYACGLLDYHAVTGDGPALDRARALVDQAESLFAAPDGGWYLTAEDVAAPLGRRIGVFDSVEPCGGSAMCHALIGLAAATGETSYAGRAARAVALVAPHFERVGGEFAWWADAALLLREAGD